ncbi:hypothetical protein [Nocardia jiangxiensis]|uniref:4Fe-4S Wbl-type domain-containing protein n=1 Tax=Nocardia jiangxiensis TaxID=282685 RepID=A0ABW6S0Q9_9NOCA|nr:hypothetical protein [Nocardia jiangxiensis]
MHTNRIVGDSPAPTSVTTIHGSKSTRRPPCADGPDDWDMDSGNPDSWRTAVRICAECPLYTNCRELAETLAARGNGPRGMIWAGVAYDSMGKIVENLDRHRVASIDHKRPLRIFHNGERPVRADSASSTPRRRIVLGHRLRPTGTGH